MSPVNKISICNSMKDKVVVLGSFIISILILVLIKTNEYFTADSDTTAISVVNIGWKAANDRIIKDAIGIVLDNNNNFFVLTTESTESSTTSGIVYKITPSYSISTVISTNLSLPQKITLDPSSGAMIIANSGNDYVYVFNTATYLLAQSYSGFESPQGVAVDSSRNLYIADAGANKLYYIRNESTTKNIISYTYNGSNRNTFNNIRKVFVTLTDDIYVLCDGLTSTTSYIIVKVGNKSNLTSGFTITNSSIVATFTDKPNSFTVDSSGNIYVVKNSSSISLYVPSQSLWILTNILLSSVAVTSYLGSSVDTTSLTTPLTTGICTFTDIVVDSSKNCYITDPVYGVWKMNLQSIVNAAMAEAPGKSATQIAAANAAAAAEAARLAALAAEAAAIAARPPVRGRFDSSGNYVDGSGNIIPFNFDNEIMSKTYDVPTDFFKAVTKHYDQNKIFGSWSKY